MQIAFDRKANCSKIGALYTALSCGAGDGILDPVFLSRLHSPGSSPGTFSCRPSPSTCGVHSGAGRAQLSSPDAQVYLRVSMLLIKIFSISFGMGVVTGIVMPFQFGTNWSRFADATRHACFRRSSAYEGLTAFFSRRLFSACSCSDASWYRLGSFLRGADGRARHDVLLVWIFVGHSWMQTPAGMRSSMDAFRERWLEVIFNPSFRLGLRTRLQPSTTFYHAPGSS